MQLNRLLCHRARSTKPRWLFAFGALAATLGLGSMASAQPIPAPAPAADDHSGPQAVDPSTTDPDAAEPPSQPAAPNPPPAGPQSQKPGVIVIVEPAPSAPALPPVARRTSTETWGPEPQPAAPPPYQDHELDTEYPRRGHFMFRAGVGATIQSFHGDRVLMGGPDLTIGADTKAGSYGANLAATFGRTEFGLGTWQFHAGADLVWPIGPVRLGVDPRIGFFSVSRVTFDSQFLYLTAGIAGIASVDLIHTDGFALALGVRPSIDYVTEMNLFGPGDEGGLMGVTALLDFRWRAPKGPPNPRRHKVSF